jgi:hypothetical protein
MEPHVVKRIVVKIAIFQSENVEVEVLMLLMMMIGLQLQQVGLQVLIHNQTIRFQSCSEIVKNYKALKKVTRS